MNCTRNNLTTRYNGSSFLLNDNTIMGGGISFKKIHTTPAALEHSSVNPFVYSKCLIKTDWPRYNYFFVNIFTWIDASAQVILPFIIMVICNVNIIYKVLLTKSKTNGKNSKRLRKIKGMCIMIISVSIIFFVLEMPVLIFLCVMQGKFENTLTIDMLWTIVNLMMYTNHVINFFSYCMTGTKFRRELLYLICIDLRMVRILPECVTSSCPSLLYSHKMTNISYKFKSATTVNKSKKSSKKLIKEKETMYLKRLDNDLIEDDPISVYPTQNNDQISKRVNFEQLNMTINAKVVHDQLKTSSLTSLIYKKKKALQDNESSNESGKESNENETMGCDLKESKTSMIEPKGVMKKPTKFSSVKQVKKRSSLKRQSRRSAKLDSSESNPRQSSNSPPDCQSGKKIVLV